MKNQFLTVWRALRVIAAATALFGSIPVVAQMNLATLSGTTIDQSDALIQDAKVTARNTATGVESTVETGKGGTFRLLDLSHGTYEITAKHPGFEQVEVSNVALHIGDEKSLTLKMTVGAESQHIEVNADQEALTSTAGSVSTVISQQFVKNLPLNGRSFQDLVLVTPGVVTTSPQVGLSNGNSGQFSIYGQTLNSNSYQLDDVSANTGTGGSYGYSNVGAPITSPASQTLDMLLT
jgi:Carboxypeptidase regulatory-like domain